MNRGFRCPWEYAPRADDVHLELVSRIPPQGSETPDVLRRPPLLFVHGAGGGAWQFAEYWLPAAARRGFPGYAVSLRGHGDSGGKERLRRTVLPQYERDVLTAISRLPEPPILIGYATGALLVQAVAERYPARGLVLVCPSPSRGATRIALRAFRRAPLAMTRGVLTGRPHPNPRLLFNDLEPARAKEFADRMGPESPLALLAMMKSRSFTRPSCPTAVFAAGRDRLHPASEFRAIAANLGLTVRWLPDSSHTPMLDTTATDSLNRILDWVEHAAARRAPGQHAG